MNLGRMFDSLNRQFWDGRLPKYRVRQKAQPWRNGLCDPRSRTISISTHRAGSEEAVRRTLLHEMCHIVERSGFHGPKFCEQLLRLAERGEEWARAEAAMLRDPDERILVRASAITQWMEDWINSVDADTLPPWKRARTVIAHEFGMSSPDFAMRYPKMRAAWLRLTGKRRREDEMVARMRSRWR